MVYPKGDSSEEKPVISVLLCLCNCLQSEQNVFAEFKLRIRDQIKGEHKENRGKSNIFYYFLVNVGNTGGCLFSMCFKSYQNYMVELKGFSLWMYYLVSFICFVPICLVNLFDFFFLAGEVWFSSSKKLGYPEFLLLKDLNNASKGFLVNDTVLVEAEIIVMCKLK